MTSFPVYSLTPSWWWSDCEKFELFTSCCLQRSAGRCRWLVIS